MLLHEFGDKGERQLEHHTHESPHFKRFQRHTDQVLVEEGAEEEHSYTGRHLSIAHPHHRNVQVTDTPTMHRHVPGAPERVDVVRVPPVAVEVAVCELQHLSQQVHERVEGQVEEAQPDQVVRYLK